MRDFPVLSSAVLGDLQSQNSAAGRPLPTSTSLIRMCSCAPLGRLPMTAHTPQSFGTCSRLVERRSKERTRREVGCWMDRRLRKRRLKRRLTLQVVRDLEMMLGSGLGVNA